MLGKADEQDKLADSGKRKKKKKKKEKEKSEIKVASLRMQVGLILTPEMGVSEGCKEREIGDWKLKECACLVGDREEGEKMVMSRRREGNKL
jgi:hypothetical protein